MEKDSKKYKKLTKKQEAFCCEYVIDYNATQALIRAGFSSGGASQTASRLLTLPKIQAKIAELEAKKQEGRDITIDRILSEYAKIAFTDLPSIVGYSKGVMSITDFESLTDEQRGCIKKFKIKTGKPMKDNPDEVPCDYVELELHDKQHALDMLGKHLGMFVDKVDLKVKEVPKLEIIRKNNA